MYKYLLFFSPSTCKLLNNILLESYILPKRILLVYLVIDIKITLESFRLRASSENNNKRNHGAKMKRKVVILFGCWKMMQSAMIDNDIGPLLPLR